MGRSVMEATIVSSIPEWITAFATVGSALGTIGAVIVALWLARNKGRETREREDRRQAEQITAWFVPYTGEQSSSYMVYMGLRVRNASDQLVYDLIAEVVSVQGAFRDAAVGESGERNLEYGTLVGNVPPGEVTTRINTGGRGMYVRHAIELAFKDAAGRCWLRRGNGSLERINKHPIELYDIPLPVSWED